MALLRPRYAIQLSVEERQQIEALLRAGKTQQRVAKRAAAILLADAGMNHQAIADHLETSRPWVQKWRKRCAPYEVKAPPSGQEAGPPVRLPALGDWPRSGRPPVVSPSGPSRGGARGVSGRAGAGLQWVFARPRA
jgi:Homeodomain-like domain